MAKKTAAAWGLEVAENVLQERHPSAQAKGMQREAFAENVPAGILGTAKKNVENLEMVSEIYDDL